MRCIIVDDEATAREIIKTFCYQDGDIEVVACFPDAIEALKFLNRETVDLIFLDIHMPGLSGIDLIQTLKQPPRIILTTSDTDFAIEAFEYPFIVDYLVKPINFQRFSKAVAKLRGLMRGWQPDGAASESLGSAEDTLYINIDRRLIKIKFEDIQFVEAQGDYIEVRTIGEVFRVHSTMKKIREKLPERIFLQIHRSYIINFNKIIDIQDNSVLIERHVIPISRKNRPELMQKLNLL